jgi:hypothetical protein
MGYIVKTNISSSFIEAAIYNPFQQDLIVTMSSGNKYIYHGVPDNVAAKLAVADSTGTYFNKHIKNMYPFDRV